MKQYVPTENKFPEVKFLSNGKNWKEKRFHLVITILSRNFVKFLSYMFVMPLNKNYILFVRDHWK